MFLSYGYYYGGFRYGMGMFYDPTMIFVLIGLALSLLASALVKGTFAKYSKVRSMSGMTGAQAASRILHSAGIYDVNISHVAGNLTYNSASVAAVGVAAHECGHAIQHQKRYAPLVLRSTLVPAANIGSSLAWPVFFIGMIASLPMLTTVGIILFGLAVVFQLVTLPVELNASRRAVRLLEDTGVLGHTENSGVKKVLTAAALTYVASLAASVLQLLRLLVLAGGRRRND